MSSRENVWASVTTELALVLHQFVTKIFVTKARYTGINEFSYKPHIPHS